MVHISSSNTDTLPHSPSTISLLSPLTQVLYSPGQSRKMFSRSSQTPEQLDNMLAADQPAAEATWDQYKNQLIRDTSRLGMLPETRLMLASTASFGVGASLGLSQGSTMAGLRFRAEHAHKLPTTPTGWFMYHKSKNYNMAKDGLKEGVKMGFKVCVVTTAMFFIEDLYDEYRQSKDFINTTLASLTVAGGFSLWSMSTLSLTPISWLDVFFFSHRC